ncbi:hypothetical protein QFZ39_005796 [Paraburkholderia graminis]|nr:hypothetical protein [Paraburkholderia graminis]
MHECRNTLIEQKGHRYAAHTSRLRRRHAYHPESVHSSGRAARVRARRSVVRASRRAASRRHGADVRRRREPRGGRRRVGRARQRIRPLDRARVLRRVRRGTAVSVDGRAAHASAREPRQSSGWRGAPRRRRASRDVVGGTRRCDRLAVGAVRGTDPRPCDDGRDPASARRRGRVAVARVRSGRGGIACDRARNRRTRRRVAQALVCGERARASGARRGRGAVRCGHCTRLRYARAGAVAVAEYDRYRRETGAALVAACGFAERSSGEGECAAGRFNGRRFTGCGFTGCGFAGHERRAAKRWRASESEHDPQNPRPRQTRRPQPKNFRYRPKARCRRCPAPSTGSIRRR